MNGTKLPNALAERAEELLAVAGDRLGQPEQAGQMLEPLVALIEAGSPHALEAPVLEVEIRWRDDEPSAGEAEARSLGIPSIAGRAASEVEGPWLVPVPFAGGAIVRLGYSALLRLLAGPLVASLAPSLPVQAVGQGVQNDEEVEDEHRH
ncbi:hypothetical protein [Candidatus Amarobacter glycogenicus]|uniref:hypothetical protein n=1 Tax=Candidatus Amarobacter glycogenicus TaxID=3140699 RepID=UPI002A0AD090|nr:hypothetical protein [Dehalococcoidia bacterium]